MSYNLNVKNLSKLYVLFWIAVAIQPVHAGELPTWFGEVGLGVSAFSFPDIVARDFPNPAYFYFPVNLRLGYFRVANPYLLLAASIDLSGVDVNERNLGYYGLPSTSLVSKVSADSFGFSVQEYIFGDLEGLFLRQEVGVSRVFVQRGTDASNSSSGAGLALSGAVGYSFQISRSVRLARLPPTLTRGDGESHCGLAT
jgi:hypothetical protein